MMAGYNTGVMMTKIFLDKASLLVDIITRIIIFKHIDIRLWVPRIRGEFKNHSFFFAHVPTEKKSERRISCIRLKRMYKQFPS